MANAIATAISDKTASHSDFRGRYGADIACMRVWMWEKNRARNAQLIYISSLRKNYRRRPALAEKPN
jgi:hypothetical protein